MCVHLRSREFGEDLRGDDDQSARAMRDRKARVLVVSQDRADCNGFRT